MQPGATAFHELACAALRSEGPAWPFGPGHAAAKGFIDFCAYHGIGPLVLDQLSETPAWSGWHGAVREALLREQRTLVAVEMLRRRETTDLLAGLHRIGVKALLLKGTALAFGLYGEPTLRTRTDTDLLIDADDKARAFEYLAAQGYASPAAVSGEYVSTQRLFMKEAHGLRHAIDLHWRINNAQVLAGRFEFAELAQDALPVPALGLAARRLSNAYALLHACLHRAAHAKHGDADRLQWFYDMHLLAAALDQSGWERFARLAGAKGLRSLCADALGRCSTLLNTPVPAAVTAVLQAPGARAELSAALLGGGKVKTLLADYRALPSWRARWQLLREQLLPDAGYMRARYGAQGRFGLARAYLARMARAPRRLFATARRSH